MFQISRTKMDGPMTTNTVVSCPEAADEQANGGRGDVTSAELRVLGLPAEASWEEIREAHAKLVADLTPGPEASHGNVALARRLLDEVNLAFDSLRARSSVA